MNACFIQVVSDKQLVKHLQTEVARLEAELRTPDRASSSDILIMEKDRKIRQVMSLTDSLFTFKFQKVHLILKFVTSLT